MLCIPLPSVLVVQPLSAEQLSASVEVHESVVNPPLVTEVGLALNVTVGAGADTTTVTDPGLETFPYESLHVIVYFVVTDSGPTEVVPEGAVLAVHPPLAEHEVAPEEVHEIWLDPPGAIIPG